MRRHRAGADGRRKQEAGASRGEERRDQDSASRPQQRTFGRSPRAGRSITHARSKAVAGTQTSVVYARGLVQNTAEGSRRTQLTTWPGTLRYHMGSPPPRMNLACFAACDQRTSERDARAEEAGEAAGLVACRAGADGVKAMGGSAAGVQLSGRGQADARGGGVAACGVERRDRRRRGVGSGLAAAAPRRGLLWRMLPSHAHVGAET